MPRFSIAVLVALMGLAACGEDPPVCGAEAEHEHAGTPTGATCNGSTLTYDNFGRQFMESYCTGCHSSDKKGEEARHCAPDDHNFDTLDLVVLNRDHIDETAAVGPNATNDAMPPSGARPTDEERRNLAIWLACEEDALPPP